MRKCIWIIMFMIMVSLVSAVIICEDKLPPGQNCTMLTPSLACSSNYSLYNRTDFIRQSNMTLINNSIYSFVFNESKGDYIIQLCDNSTREMIVEGEDEMASLSIMIFILIVTAGIAIIPFFKKFSKFEISNLIIKRSCWVVALYLMMFNASIAATIAENAGLGLTQEMFRYMWFFGMAGWLAIVYLFLKTLLDVLRLWRFNTKKRKEDDLFGLDDEDVF